MVRIVGHLDLDYFYAQVEEVENPSLKGTPVVVCVYSGRTEDSGVVSTANYKAREHGVGSGMPITFAKRRLEGAGATFIPIDLPKYQTYSDGVMDILRGSVDTTEQTGIDEAFFDVTKRAGGDYAEARAIALGIKRKVLSDERLTCSLGIGPNKVVAKIASGASKPDGLTVVTEAQATAFLSPLSVDKIYGVGPKTAKVLKDNGIVTVADLSKFPLERLEDVVGRKLGVYLHNASMGLDNEPVTDRGESTQLSRIVTLKEDTDDPEKVLAELLPALRDLHSRLASSGTFFKSISVIGILRDLSIRTKSRTLDTPTNEYFVMERDTRELFLALVGEVGGLRRAGVRVSGLQDMTDQRSLAEYTS